MDKSVWKLFSKHHYLDHKHNNAARVYICYINDNPAGFISMMPQPGKHTVGDWRVHRLVVLPDYQGIGIGLKILNDVAELYRLEGIKVRIVTSAPSLLKALNRKGSKWNCISFGRKKPSGGLMENYNKSRGAKHSLSSTSNRISASFYYKQNDKNDNKGK